LRRKTRWPPGRSSLAASGIHFAGSHQIDAPYSEITRSKLAFGRPVSSAFASTKRSPSPNSASIRRAVSSCAGVTSTPTTRAPCRASHAPKYAVPQPSSTTSLPSNSGSTPISPSRAWVVPQVISSSDQASCAFASV
jgi:hypothetical protein